MSAGCPKRCTGRSAFVRGVIAASILAGSIVKVSGSISTSTGRAPAYSMAAIVATKVQGASSGVHRDTIMRSAILAERLFKIRHSRSENEGAALEHLLNSSGDLRFDGAVLGFQIRQGNHACIPRASRDGITETPLSCE